MSKIDVSQWKDFKLTKLFESHHGKRLTKRNRISGEIPFLTAGFDKQGVKGYLAGNFEIWHNPISIDMFGNCFYHEYDCAGDDNVYVLVNNDMTSNVKLFIASVLNKQLSIQFSYKDQFRQHDLDVLSIKLPVDSAGNPDWQYMDSYIAKRAALAHKYVSELKSTKNQRKSLKISGWQEYKLGDLFEPEFTDGDNKVQNLEQSDDGVNLVGPLNSNNGVLGKFISDTKVFPVGTLTWDMFGKCYEQFEPYQTVSHGHVLVLNPKVKLDELSLLFVASVLTRLGQNSHFGYNNMLTISKFNKLTIKLPALSDGTPDWATMRERVVDLQCSVYRTMILLLDLV